uniref:Uncharacterized protein n=1 Tax=Anguilla anguilla TaxID=7936 RepID=A0A0E9X6Q4_ANGAN
MLCVCKTDFFLHLLFPLYGHSFNSVLIYYSEGNQECLSKIHCSCSANQDVPQSQTLTSYFVCANECMTLCEVDIY